MQRLIEYRFFLTVPMLFTCISKSVTRKMIFIRVSVMNGNESALRRCCSYIQHVFVKRRDKFIKNEKEIT